MSGPALQEVKEHINGKGKGHEGDAESHGENKFALIIFQGHGRGHGSGKPFGVAAEHHTYAHLGDNPTEGGDDRGEDTVARLFEDDQRHLGAVRAKGQGGHPVALVNPADGGYGQGHDDRHNKNDLTDNYRLLGIQKIERAENAAPGDKGIYQQTDDHGGQSQQGV